MYFHLKPFSKKGGAVATKLPTRGKDPAGEVVSVDAVGWDLYAPEDNTIMPFERKIVPLGFAASFTPGYIGKMFDRSGMGSRGIMLLAGVIDPDFRNEWGVILFNTSPELYKWNKGDRICQVVFWQVEINVEPSWVTELEQTVRNMGGIGSSGK